MVPESPGRSSNEPLGRTGIDSVIAAIVRFSLAAFVFVATIQALYWPLLPKPGTTYRWWQIHWLAGSGMVVGLPVLFLSNWIGEFGLWVATLVWAALVYFLSGLVRQVLRRGSHAIS